jgi:hypothetical protein
MIKSREDQLNNVYKDHSCVQLILGNEIVHRINFFGGRRGNKPLDKTPPVIPPRGDIPKNRCLC